VTSEDAEKLIFEIVGGEMMPKGWPFDVKSGNGTCLEIKHAPAYQHGKSKNPRWRWVDALGCNRRKKQYDRLILVGEGESILDRPYYLFDLPYLWVLEHTDAHGRDIFCALRNVKSPIGRELHAKFKLDKEQLAQRYESAKKS
jgi:hypothetical protein